MDMSGCNEFLNQVDAWLDGDHAAGARAHLRDCARCRGLVDDLDAIRQGARAWAAEEAEPPARVWTSLRAQLGQEGLIRSGRDSRRWAASLARWLEDTFAAVPRPALAGAYLIALIAVGVALVGPTSKQFNDSRWIERTQFSTSPLSAQLDTAEQSMVSSLSADSVVTASLHENLAIVDNYIALCEKSVREEPQNEVARDYLFGAYQQKADLLAQITERGDNGR
jgi:hypothetical protein